MCKLQSKFHEREKSFSFFASNSVKFVTKCGLKNFNNLQNFLPKQEHFSEYFKQYKQRTNHFFRRCIDVAMTLLHRRRFTDIFKKS